MLLIMVALCNRADHYIFIQFLSFFFIYLFIYFFIYLFYFFIYFLA